jgi:hypothetical protein
MSGSEQHRRWLRALDRVSPGEPDQLKRQYVRALILSEAEDYGRALQRRLDEQMVLAFLDRIGVKR